MAWGAAAAEPECGVACSARAAAPASLRPGGLAVGSRFGDCRLAVAEDADAARGQLLDRRQEAAVIRRHEGEGAALLAGAAGATDAVDIVLGMDRDVEIDHAGHVVDIEAARRRGRLSTIDIALADKVVGAAAETARAVTIEWEPVEDLNSWRFGLSTATAMMPPERLINAANLRTQAWLARSPMFPATQKLRFARSAAALGVFSSQAMLDLYTSAYDATEPDALGDTEAWQLRLAYIGRDEDARLSAMRTIWGNAQSPLDRVATQVLLSRAARYIAPSGDLQSDASDLIASLLAGGFDLG